MDARWRTLHERLGELTSVPQGFTGLRAYLNRYVDLTVLTRS